MDAREIHPEHFMAESPQSALEHQLIVECLLRKGYRLIDLKKLPEKKTEMTMKEACLYAALKLAEIEARSNFIHEIVTS